MLGMITNLIWAGAMIWAGYVAGRTVQYRRVAGRWPDWRWIADVAVTLRAPKD